MVDRVPEFITAMADSVGVIRYKDESVSSFCTRVTYTCARPWIWAACMDDGAGGCVGIAKQAINARLKRWLLSMDSICPGLAAWYGANLKLLHLVYDRLIDVDDIIDGPATDRYVAHVASLAQIDEGHALVIGAYEMGDKASKVCGLKVQATVTSGLATLVAHSGMAPEPITPFWECNLQTMDWSRASDIGVVEYIDLGSRSVGLRRAESWKERPMWADGLAIARLQPSGIGPVEYYVARQTARGNLLARIDDGEAEELLLHLRAVSGHEIVTRAHAMDSRHVRLDNLPIPMLRDAESRYVDALTWPIQDVGGWYQRIARHEALSTIRGLLERCDVRLREV